MEKEPPNTVRKRKEEGRQKRKRQWEMELWGVQPSPLFDQWAWLRAKKCCPWGGKSFSAWERNREKWSLGLCHSQLGIALFPKMGIPSRPRINGTVGAKKWKNSSIFKEVWFVVTMLKASVDLGAGSHQHGGKRQLRNPFCSDFVVKYQRSYVKRIYHLCLWTSDQEEKARANRFSRPKGQCKEANLHLCQG